MKPNFKLISFTFLLDVLSFIAIFIISLGFTSFFNSIQENTNLAESVWDLSNQQLKDSATLLKTTYFQLISIIVIFILLSLLVWILSRALIWLFLLNKKPNKKFFVNSYKLLIWFIPLFAILYFIPISLKASIRTPITLVLIFIAVYFSNIILINYAKLNKLKLNFDFKSLLIFLIISVLFLVFYKIVTQLPATFILLAYLLILIYFAFARFYFIQFRGAK